MIVSDAIASWRQQPFQRGSTDCCAFVDHVLYELTGESRLPAYDDDASAERIIGRHGTLKDAVTYYMGCEPVPSETLKPGDIALVEVMGHQSIGVLMENRNVAVVFEQGGLREIRPDFTDEGWSIGR